MTKFWSAGFTICCFIPLVILTALYVYSGNYKDAFWQMLTLVLLMVNNYLLCENRKMRKLVLETAKDNLELIELSQKLIKETKNEKECEK